MANQSTKYRRFLAGAATASLVATAIVPTALAAGFSDVPATDTHYENITKAVELGLFKGKGDGTFGPYENITRGQVAKVLANYVVKQEGLTYATYIEKHNLTDTVAPFNDVPSTYADSELYNASLIVKSSGIFTGSNNNLMPAKDIVRQQMAKVLVNGFDLVDLPGDLSKVTDNNTALAEFVPQINILSENGVTVTEAFRPTENVVRGQMASFLNRAYEIANPEVVAPEVVSVSTIDVNKVEVKFNGAVDTSKAVVKLTKGLANYNVTTAWNDAKDTVVITSVLSKLSPADYTVVVEGLTSEALSANFKFEAEKASKLEVTTSKVNVAGTATVYLNVLNQYGTKFTTVDPSKLTLNTTESIADVSFSAVTEGASSDAKGNLKGDFTITNTSDKLKAGDTFKVTAVYEGLTGSADVTFVNPIDLDTLSFGQVAPLIDKSRITVGDDNLVVPYTAVDQYGAAYELTLDENITWVSSDSDIVDVDSLEIVDKKLTVDAGTKAGTAIITAILSEGTTAQFSVTVEAEAYANTVSISAPTTLVANGEKASLDIVVQDQFGQVIPNKDVTGLLFSNGFTINAKTGKLEGTVTQNTAFKVTATRDSDDKELAAVTFAVEAEAIANTITAVNFETLFEVGASKELILEDIVVKDQYGRAFSPETVEVTEVDATNTKFSVVTNELTAEAAGTKVFKVAVDGSASAVKNVTLTAIASKDINSYELAPIGTIYNDAAYAATPELMGKTADGKSVVLVAGKIDSLTSSNENVAVTNGLTVEGALAPTAADATSTIKAWSADGTLLGSAVVTVTNVAPKLDSIVAAETLGADAASVFTSKDQYGKTLAEEGNWYFTSTAANGATTAAAAGTLTFDVDDADSFTLASGEYAVKFVSKDGETVATTVITLPQ